MALVQQIAPTTAAVSTPVDFDASFFQTIIIAADKLATTETVTVALKVNGSYVPAANLQGTAAGLTATVGSITMPGGVTYGLTKASTATACGVYAGGIYRN